MSELQEGFLEQQELPARTLAEAFGFSLFDLHIANEEGKEVSDHVRERVFREIQREKITT